MSTGNQFPGISGGLIHGVTDPGQTNYALGFNPGPTGTGMLYHLAAEGTRAPGITSILFLPQTANNNYDYLAM